MLSDFLMHDIHAPGRFDFDKQRRAITIRGWGNTEWNNAVIAAAANHLLRIVRVEWRGNILLTDNDVIARYKALTGSIAPEDTRDVGLDVLGSLKDWRNSGWPVDTKAGIRTFKISAYGEIEPNDPVAMRVALYALHGVQIGLQLPAAVMGNLKFWHYKGESSAEWKPGSWGGMLVYAKAYNEDVYEIVAWGKRIAVTNEFVARYADEAWSVVGDLNDWRTRQAVDVVALSQRLNEISHAA